jgi:hypothetical protein
MSVPRYVEYFFPDANSKTIEDILVDDGLSLHFQTWNVYWIWVVTNGSIGTPTHNGSALSTTPASKGFAYDNTINPNGTGAVIRFLILP